MHDPFDFDRPLDPPYVWTPVSPSNQHPLPERLRERILVHTVHDGGAIPRYYRETPEGRPRVDPDVLRRAFVRERDWGANIVAAKLAAALGLPGFARCRVARVLLDFNRFPGTTPPIEGEPLERMAINPPFDTALTHTEKMQLLRLYDAISERAEKRFANALISISIHTYDERNPSTTRRADLSLVSVPMHYMREATMPYGVFDPLYPSELAESTCSRVLRDRIALNLERSGFRVSHNQPYPLPEGSIEVRAQVWFFFRYLQQRFEEAHPESKGRDDFNLVWAMLLNTNQRSHEAEAFRGWLHRYRRVSDAEERRFEKAREAYEEVRAFLNESSTVQDYRSSRQRPSSLGIEVRKDLLFSFDKITGQPLPPSEEHKARAKNIAEVIAGALQTYFETDRPQK